MSRPSRTQQPSHFIRVQTSHVKNPQQPVGTYRSRQAHCYRDVYIERRKSTATSPVDKSVWNSLSEFTHTALMILKNGAKFEIRQYLYLRQTLDCREVETECTLSHSSPLLPGVWNFVSRLSCMLQSWHCTGQKSVKIKNALCTYTSLLVATAAGLSRRRQWSQKWLMHCHIAKNEKHRVCAVTHATLVTLYSSTIEPAWKTQ